MGTQVPFLTLPWVYFVILSKSLNLYEPQFPDW